MKIQKLFEKYKDVLPYLFFGVCTTIVNVIVYWIAAYPLRLPIMPSTVIAWFLAVFFAYVTNRKWVFRSEAKELKKIVREAISFLGCRLATGIIDWMCMLLFVDILSMNDIIIKLMANILVIVLNYAASKLVIFKK